MMLIVSKPSTILSKVCGEFEVSTQYNFTLHYTVCGSAVCRIYNSQGQQVVQLTKDFPSALLDVPGRYTACIESSRDYGELYGEDTEKGSEYVLPPATADVLGGIKVGDGLSVESDGTLNADCIVVPGKAAGLKKVDDYLYETTLDGEPDYDFAELWFDDSSHGGPAPAGCSVVRNGRYIGRNYDWYYNHSASVIIHSTPGVHTFGSVGVASSVPGLTAQNIDRGDIVIADDILTILPHYTVDGINSKGVFAAVLVVPMNPAEQPSSIVSTPRVELRTRLCANQLVRFILDKAVSAQDIIDYICDYCQVWVPATLLSNNYRVQWAIFDKHRNLVLDIDSNGFHTTELIFDEEHGYKLPIVTNFCQAGVTFNENGYIGTPDGLLDPVTDNHADPYSSGLERYNIAAAHILSLPAGEEPENQVKRDITYCMCKDLKYSNLYTGYAIPDSTAANYGLWCTEFVGINNLVCNSSTTDFADVFTQARALYAERDRDVGGIWQTVHSVVYDLVDMTADVIPQESGKVYTASLQTEAVYIQTYTDYNTIVSTVPNTIEYGTILELQSAYFPNPATVSSKFGGTWDIVSTDGNNIKYSKTDKVYLADGPTINAKLNLLFLPGSVLCFKCVPEWEMPRPGNTIYYPSVTTPQTLIDLSVKEDYSIVAIDVPHALPEYMNVLADVYETGSPHTSEPYIATATIIYYSEPNLITNADCSSMFSDFNKWLVLDLTPLTVNNSTNIQGMFSGNSSVARILVDSTKWAHTQTSTQVFSGNSNLRGKWNNGIGHNTFMSTHVSAEYAIIANSNNSGYLTDYTVYEDE